jgi:hypothetical protein
MSRTFRCELGRGLAPLGTDPVRLTDQELEKHVAVVGGSGFGKSRLLSRIVDDHIDRGEGIMVIEPGDLCDDTLGRCARRVVKTGSNGVLRRLHHLRAGPVRTFRYDAFRFRLYRPIHPELLDAARRSWAHCKAQTVAEIFQAKGTGSSDFEGQPRVQRWLTNTLLWLTVEVEGRRLSLADAMVALDLEHPLHGQVFARIEPHLPREILADYQIVHAMTRVEDLRRETESTVNRYRSLLSPLLKAVLSGTGSEPAVDLYSIIQNGHCLLVPVQEDQFFSHDQKVALSHVLLHDVIETLILTPREKRRPFTIVIDEAGEFVTDRLIRALGMIRKHGGRFVIAGQDLSTFRKGDLDMAPKLLSQCGTVISFNQKWPEDTEILSRVLFSGNLDFTPLVQEVERHGGYEWHQVAETSEQVSSQFSVAVGHTETETTTGQVTDTTTSTKTASETDTAQRSFGTGESRRHDDPAGARAVRQRNASAGAGHASARGTALGTAHAVGRGTAKGRSDSVVATEGGGRSRGVSHKQVPLASVVREPQKTGAMETALADQWEKFRALLSCAPPRHAFAKVAGRTEAIAFVTADVPDPFASPEALAAAIEWVKRELHALHAYFFAPDLSPGEEERRLREFLGGADADEPLVVGGDDEAGPFA